MLKPALVAVAFATFGAATAYAQTTSPPATTPAPVVRDRVAGPAFTADTRKLIGRNVQDVENRTIGEIEAIYLDSAGRVDSVIIGVGGFLGMGERNVRVAWTDIAVANNGEKVTTALTKDQLKALPEYKYRDGSYRRQTFNDTGVVPDGAPLPGRPAVTDRAPPPPVATVPAGVPGKPSKDFNADGNISTDAIEKASVRNAANESVGAVESVYVDKDGKIQTIVVSVGGFLGMGKKDVAMKWTDLQIRRDGDKLILLTTATSGALKAMPDYTYDRNEAARK